MQQYSSLPDYNSHIDATPTLLTEIEELGYQLWLERSLNQLQHRLNDCLISVFTTNKQVAVPEAEIFQTLVSELNTLVNEVNSALNRTQVVLALVEPQETVCKVCYVSGSPPQLSQTPLLGVMGNRGKKLHLTLKEVIEIEDLQYLETQQPPSAWRLSDKDGGVIGWLILAKASIQSGGKSLQDTCTTLTSQLMARATQQCAANIVQVRQMQSLQQECEKLSSFNEELKRTNELKNQFLANTSHEIRTPLSSVIGFTHLLLAQGYDSTKERHQEYLHIIQSSGRHLLALINDILDLSKIEANLLEVQWETVDLPTLCRNVFALVKEKAANKGLKLQLDLDPNVTSLIVDPLRLKQMLLNLLFNALKFTSTGTVGLQVKPNGLFMHFIVWDTGTGISKQHQVELFQPYFQIPNTASGHDEGTGLGLAVTQKLAELQGGSVEVESEVDRGSRFTIVLPLNPVRQDEGDESEDSESGTPTDAKISIDKLSVSSFTPHSPDILLVEDDLPNAQMMQTYLKRLGYEVTWVKNATEMWESLKQLHPAVILMDIKLPDSNGLKLVQELRGNQHYRTIPVIAQTSMAMKGDREICLAAGINDYISKPIDLIILATLVSKYSKRGGEEGGRGGNSTND